MKTTLPVIWIKSVAMVLLTYYVIATVVSLIPHQSFLATRLSPLFVHFQIATGSQQHWDMFTEIPNRRSYAIDIQAIDSNGEVHAFGPILPGLRKLDPSSMSFRHHTMFDRFTTEYYHNYVMPYARAARVELKKRCKDYIQLESFGLEIRAEHISPLNEIREGGPVTVLRTISGGPWTLDE